MHDVVAALGNQVHSRTCCEAELWQISTSVDLKLLDRFDVYRCAEDTCSILVFSTINREQVGVAVAAAYSKPRRGPGHSRVLHSRRFWITDSRKNKNVRHEIAAYVWK